MALDTRDLDGPFVVGIIGSDACVAAPLHNHAVTFVMNCSRETAAIVD